MLMYSCICECGDVCMFLKEALLRLGSSTAMVSLSSNAERIEVLRVRTFVIGLGMRHRRRGLELHRFSFPA